MTRDTTVSRRYRWRAAVVAALILVAPIAVHAEIPFIGKKEKPIVVPQGSRFVDLLGSLIALPSDNDMALRFRDGKRYDPQQAVTLDDPAFQGHIDAMHSITDDLLAHYTKGPKPPYMPIRIVESNDINFMIVPIDDDKPADEAPTVVGIFKTLTARSKPTDGAPAELPQRIELQATRLALDTITDDNEVAFLIAHETSHVLLGHWEREESRIRRQKKIDAALQAGVLIAALLNSDYRMNGNTLNMTTRPEFGKISSKLILTAILANEYNLVIRGPKWEAEQERQADLLALDLLYEAGRPRTGATSVMDKFDEAEKALKAQGTPFADILFKSAAASALIQAQNGQKGKNIVTTVVFQSGIAMYAHWREERLQKVHDNSAARAIVIHDYEASHPEPEAAASATKANFFAKHLFKDTSAPVVAVRNLLQELASNKDCDDLTPAAKTVLDGLRAKPIGDMSQSESLALSQYYSCKAQWKEALPYAEATAHGKSRTGPYYAVLLTVQQALDQYDPVLKTVEEASVEAPPEGQYMPYKVRALKRLKRDDEAKATAEACKTSQNQGTGTLCMAEVGLTYAGEPLSQDENADGTDSAETKSLIDRILQAE